MITSNLESGLGSIFRAVPSGLTYLPAPSLTGLGGGAGVACAVGPDGVATPEGGRLRR
jgi:hypothetical protein